MLKHGMINLIVALTLFFSLEAMAKCDFVGSYHYQTNYSMEDGRWEVCDESGQEYFKFTYNGNEKKVVLKDLKNKIKYLNESVGEATKKQNGEINESFLGCNGRWEFSMQEGSRVKRQQGCLTSRREAYQEFRLHFHSWYGEHIL